MVAFERIRASSASGFTLELPWFSRNSQIAFCISSAAQSATLPPLRALFFKGQVDVLQRGQTSDENRSSSQEVYYVQKYAETEKPYLESPLTFRRNSQWCQRIREKTQCFGTDADAAIRKYVDEWDDLQAERQPKTTTDTTLRDLVRRYLTMTSRRRALIDAASDFADAFNNRSIVPGLSVSSAAKAKTNGRLTRIRHVGIQPDGNPPRDIRDNWHRQQNKTH